MEILLWVIAVILIVAGVLRLIAKDVLWGLVLLIVGLVVVPVGTSLLG